MQYFVLSHANGVGYIQAFLHSICCILWAILDDVILFVFVYEKFKQGFSIDRSRQHSLFNYHDVFGNCFDSIFYYENYISRWERLVIFWQLSFLYCRDVLLKLQVNFDFKPITRSRCLFFLKQKFLLLCQGFMWSHENSFQTQYIFCLDHCLFMADILNSCYCWVNLFYCLCYDLGLINRWFPKWTIPPTIT